MRFGLPHWIGAGPPYEGVRAAAENGFDFLELSLDEPWPVGLDAGALADACREQGVALGIHAPWRAQTLAHPRRALAMAAEVVLEPCVKFARAAHAEYLVVHVATGAFATLPHPDAVEAGMQHARDALKRLVQRGGDELDVLVENTETPVGTPAECAALLNAVPGLGFCLDVGHAAKVRHGGTAGAADDAPTWLAEVGQSLGLVHFMDWSVHQGRVRDHLVPGAGAADLGAILGAVEATRCERVLVESFYADADGTPVTPGRIARARDALLERPAGR